jgi:alkylated DNA nucleotide flippase Atl1
LSENQAWGREEILARADALAQQVSKVWPAPLPGITSEAEGFDWSRIQAGIDVIPAGRWTTYGELAELGGTGAVAVGRYVASLPPGANAYRVLSVRGAVSEDFAWADPNDTRDVHDVLAADGIEFDEAGRASEEQWMSAEELAALIEDPEEQAGEETGLG